VSPVPYAVFSAISLLRLLSPLQWVKFFVRRRLHGRPTTNLRPDFPSAFTEWYFLFIGFTALVVLLLRDTVVAPGWIQGVGRLAGYILLMEGFTWIIYYLLLRNFVEISYTIFHPAEYLLTFPIVVAIQLVLLSSLTGRTTTDLLAKVIGNATPGDRIGVSIAVVGVIYFGVALAVVLRSHPGISTRSSQNVVIIGAGDVVINKIIPALVSSGYNKDDLLIIGVDEGLGPNSERDRASHHLGIDRVIATPEAVMTLALRERSPTIIASPTFAHFKQIVALSNAGIPFAVEKPLTSSPSEREVLAQNHELMRNGFALSYYTLEKSLPLTYLYKPIPVYSKFLRSSSGEMLESGAGEALRLALGTLQSIEILLLEGVGRSPSGKGRLWTELPSSLRSFVETTVHPLLVARHVLGPHLIEWDGCLVGKYGPREREVINMLGQSIAPTWIYAKGACANIQVIMEVGKYVPEDQTARRAELKFTHGSAVMDFDTRRLTFHGGSNDGEWIEIDSDREQGQYANNYAVLMALFGEFVLNGWGGVRFDDYFNQLIALEDWGRLCEYAERQEVEPVIYSSSIPSR
jgi:hypothetical protein